MEVRIDQAGGIVIPKPLLDRLGFKPDTELSVIEEPDGVLLKRVGPQPSMIKLDGLWVHQGEAKPEASWEGSLDDMREARIESVMKT